MFYLLRINQFTFNERFLLAGFYRRFNFFNPVVKIYSACIYLKVADMQRVLYIVIRSSSWHTFLRLKVHVIARVQTNKPKNKAKTWTVTLSDWP